MPARDRRGPSTRSVPNAGLSGTVEKYIGDAMMAVFGVPVAHDEDALRAVRATAEMRDALERLNGALRTERGVTLEAQTGVNTGPVVVGPGGPGEAIVVGDGGA
jgi:Adenylate cyclase, family 3 (some proteins contain HAMP domain)